MDVRQRTAPRRSAIVVGAGFGGIAAAGELIRHGYEDVRLLEAGQETGGTWHFNRYPGAACDVPSHLYSFSFAQRADWPHVFSPQSEILAYLRKTATGLGLDERITTRTTVTSCAWDERTRRWTVHSTGPTGRAEQRTADVLVLATGQLSRPALPAIDGLPDFAGHSFHSARWDHSYDLRGKRVAVIGTGASAAQFVPEIAPLVGRLTVFQRTGNWFLPRRVKPTPAPLTWLLRYVPGARRAWRALAYHYVEMITRCVRHPRTFGRAGKLLSSAFMRIQVKDSELRRKVWPDYPFGCKRVLLSSAFLPTLGRDDVELVTEPIERMTPDGPMTAGGRVHEVDCIIYGTGFHTNTFMAPMEVTGSGGRSLRAAWTDGAQAHLGIMVSGFPSLFLMYGPNTNTSGGSIIFFLEAQAAFLRRAVQLTEEHGAAALDVRPEAQAAYHRDVQDRFEGTAWNHCSSWYRTPNGQNVANWPGYMAEYAARTRRPDLADFRLIPEPTPEPAGSG